MQAPSPITKPARVASNGRIASVGSTSSATSPRIAQKPARMSGVIAASVPPARTMSAWPRRIVAAPSPIAVEPVAQAETGAKFGPVMPSWIAIWPLAVSTSADGMKNGETRSAAALEEDLLLLGDRRDAADRGADEDADPRRVELLDAGLVPCLLRGGDGQEDVAVHPARLLGRDQRRGIEATHLAGDPDGELARRRSSR